MGECFFGARMVCEGACVVEMRKAVARTRGELDGGGRCWAVGLWASGVVLCTAVVAVRGIPKRPTKEPRHSKKGNRGRRIYYYEVS